MILLVVVVAVVQVLLGGPVSDRGAGRAAVCRIKRLLLRTQARLSVLEPLLTLDQTQTLVLHYAPSLTPWECRRVSSASRPI